MAPVPPPTTPPAGDTAIAPPPATFSGPAPRSRPAPAQLRAPAGAPGPGVWAVVVGVNDYPGTAHDLRSAVGDAEDMNAALAAFGVPAERRLVLRDGQVTRGVLKSALAWLAKRAAPDATVVFFFAGHVRKVAGSTEAMVMADGMLVTDVELARELAAVKAHRAWIVMAACYGGGFTEVLRPGRVLTAAAGPDAIAYENLAFGRSYLVQYMVRQGFLEGRATASVQAAFAYARGAIAKDYPDRVPEQYDQAGGPVDLRQAGFQAPPAPPPSPPEQPSSDQAAQDAQPEAEERKATAPTSTTSSTTSSTTTTTQPKPKQCQLLRVGC